MLEQIQFPAWKCKCDNCKHEWTSTRKEPPTHCPNPRCSNPTKWNSGGTMKKREERAKVKADDARSYFQSWSDTIKQVEVSPKKIERDDIEYDPDYH